MHKVALPGEGCPPRRRRTGHIAWSLPLAGFSLIGVMLLVYVAQSAQLVSLQYRLGALKEVEKELIREQQDLELQIQELTALDRIERVAVHRLGMVVPRERKVLDLPGWARRDLDRHLAHQPCDVPKVHPHPTRRSIAGAP